jgi:hypothetical protein
VPYKFDREYARLRPTSCPLQASIHRNDAAAESFEVCWLGKVELVVAVTQTRLPPFKGLRTLLWSNLVLRTPEEVVTVLSEEPIALSMQSKPKIEEGYYVNKSLGPRHGSSNEWGGFRTNEISDVRPISTPLQEIFFLACLSRSDLRSTPGLCLGLCRQNCILRVTRLKSARTFIPSSDRQSETHRGQ